MKSLRRDLFERHLWPLAVVLVVAIVAAPFLLHGHRNHAGGAIPAPVSAAGVKGSPTKAKGSAGDVKGTASADAASDHVSPPGSSRPAPTSTTRSPFSTAGAPKRRGTSKGTTSKGGTSTTSTAAPTAPASTSASAVTGSASAASGTASSAPATTPAATTPAATTPATTTPSATTPTTPSTSSGTQAGPWKIYSVDLHLGPAARHDVAYLTPLPSERSPEAMYLGVTDNGRAADFALGAGVGVRMTSVERSAGVLCHPTRSDCAILVVPAGRSARLSYASATGKQRVLVLGLTRISTRITNSAAAVKAAKRQSTAGLCDLKLGDPIGFYDPTRGTLKEPSLKACRHNAKAVPFPGSLGAGSAERG